MGVEESAYRFMKLSDRVADKLSLDALPFPVRAQNASLVFDADGGATPVDRLLHDLDDFLHNNPEYRHAYAGNASKFAVICATRHASEGDFAAALNAVNVGLRADPQDRALKARQALALQVLGYDGIAAATYEQLLWNSPEAYDPLLCAFAAKAFVAIGDKHKALWCLRALPEQAFEDPELAKLRASLRSTPLATESNQEPSYAKARVPKFCSKCGATLRAHAKFCPGCGANVAAR